MTKQQLSEEYDIIIENPENTIEEVEEEYDIIIENPIQNVLLFRHYSGLNRDLYDLDTIEEVDERHWEE
jgi:hypothetical protein